MKIKKVKEMILDILLPKKCINCGKEGQYICNDCQLFLSESDNALLTKKMISVWQYEGIVEKTLLKIKYNKKYHIIEELIKRR